MAARSMRWIFAFFATLTIAATTTSDDLAAQRRGDTTVVFPRAPRHSGIATLVPELTIGSADGADEYLFNSICVVFPLRDGSVWIADDCSPVRNGVVRHYDSAGKFIRAIGRSGDGPGEYRNPSSMAQLPDGRVLVRSDRGVSRIILYRPDGRHDTTWMFRNYYTGGPRVTVATDGTVWMAFTRGNPFAGEATAQMALRIRQDGTIVDSVAFPLLPQPPRTGVSVRVGRMEMTLGAPYQPHARSILSPAGYFATYTSSRYRVDLRQAPKGATGSPSPLWRDGDRVVSIRRTVNPVAVTEAERRDRLAHLEAQYDAQRNPKTGSLGGIPREKPPIRSAAFADDGRLWISVSMPSERYEPPPPPPPREGEVQVPRLKWREPSMYDVFEPDGTLIGRVHVPYGVFWRWSSGDVVWATVRTEDGVELVRRYRIVWQ